MINLLAKFEVYIFSSSRDIRGSRNFKSRSSEYGHVPFWPIFHFFRLVSLTINLHAKFDVCIFSHWQHRCIYRCSGWLLYCVSPETTVVHPTDRVWEKAAKPVLLL